MNFFDDFNFNRTLSDDEADSCNGMLTIDECRSALESMAPNKSPGSDGLTSNFYKFFWDSIGPLVVDSFNYGFAKGTFSPEQCRGIINVIPKPNKDSSIIQNLRPITLLNTDYKIAAKAIANRLKFVLPQIIGHNQTGFMKNRFIGENIRFTLDLIDYCMKNNISGFIMFVDFEKAFDTLEWKFLHYCLKKFNFGDSFIKWIHTFQTNSSACVINNGYSSNYIKLKRGVRQGCPLSPYLFIIAVEILAQKINSNNIIKGQHILNNEVKIMQYADDTTIY